MLTNAASNFIPEPGSLAARVLDLYRLHPRDERSSHDLARAFDLPSTAQLPKLLEPCLTAQLLQFERADKSWRAGPGFAAWVQARSSATPAPAAPAKPATRATGAGRKPGPLPGLSIDPLAIVIRKNVPVPAKPTRSTQSEIWAKLWARLEPGDSVELTAAQIKSLASWCKKGKQPACTAPSDVDGMAVLWRLPEPGADKAKA